MLLGHELVLSPRRTPPLLAQVGLPVVSVAVAGLLGAVFLAVTGSDPVLAYRTMVASAFGSGFALGETLVEAAPLVLTGLAVALAFRMLLFNIGAEGQLYMGAIATAGVALLIGDQLPTAVMLPVALLAGALGGALYALLAGIPRAYFGTGEIVVTLMLNFVAFNVVNFLIFSTASVFRDPVVQMFPTGQTVPDSARLPIVTGRVDVGILLATMVAVGIWLLLRSTRWGLEVTIVGDSPEAARYAGVDLRRKILEAFAASGALAGLAGAIVVSGRVGALEPRAVLSNYGYLGILVAALARLNPLAVVPVAVFIAAMRTAGPSMQRVGVPDAIVLMLQGAALIFAVMGEFWLRYRVRHIRRPTVAAAEPHR